MIRLQTLVLLLTSTLGATTIGTDTNGALGFNSGNVFALIGNTQSPAYNDWLNNKGGFAFTVPTDMTLENLVAPFRLLSNVPHTLTFTLYSGSTIPSVAIESTSLMLPVTQSISLVQFNFSGSTLLTAGTQYFMIGSVPLNNTVNANIYWAGSNPGVPVPFYTQQTLFNSGTLPWFGNVLGSGPAWQINAPVATPEPALSVGVGICLIAIGLGKRFIARPATLRTRPFGSLPASLR